MTIHSVKVLAGFRFHLTDDDKWEAFCQGLHEHVHGDDDGSDHDDGSDNGSGSECSGSDCGSDHSDEHCECEDDEVDVFDAVWDNMDALVEGLRDKFPDLEYNTIKCFHNKEGMDRMIDIGFELGDFSVCGDHENSHQDIDRTANAIKEAKKVAFGNALDELPFWKYCTNKKGPKMLGQADNCIWCD
jgi:hypothetical protein